MRILSAAVLVSALLVAFHFNERLAFADDRELTVAVQYSGVDECEDPEPFFRALTERSSRISAGDAAVAEVLLDVQLSHSEHGVLGKLQITHLGAATEPRYVEAERCGEVVDALALTAALGIDPDALTRLPPEQAPEPERDASWRWQAALDGQLIGSMPVDLQASLGVMGGIALRSDRNDSFAPELRLSASSLQSDVFDSAALARFRLLALGVELCPWRFGSRVAFVRACGFALGGRLHATGNVSDPQQSDRNWLSLAPALDIDVRVTDALHWRLDLAANVTLTPQRYLLGIAPEQITRTPTVAPWLGFGLSYVL
ncbi:MAG TPA: hypothetical protein VHM70_01705 [Polyangiaceae bacterium]|nr:hypothetical protein [Polyangiaceae bacterium]